MTHPYENLPAHAYWRSGVAEVEPMTLEGLFEKRFEIGKNENVATAGSCFAQHLARHMRERAFKIVDVEPPLPGMSTKLAQKYGYSTYSARYGNIYTARQLLQLLRDAFGVGTSGNDPVVREEDIMERDGKFYDGLRPNVEPRGLPSREAVREMRVAHLENVRHMVRTMDVFVFTFGLTETWENTQTGTVYPVCPGVVAGEFSDEAYKFKNLSFTETLQDSIRVIEFLKRRRPDLKILITVSPVPLTATASGDHVLKATTYSKSVLRGVCGELYQKYDFVDYFPSYEIITASLTRGAFFEDNLRSVTEEGVKTVMHHFFAQHDPSGVTDAPAKKKPAKRKKTKSKDDLVCEELLLDAFSK